jgi:hypothetical protein
MFCGVYRFGNGDVRRELIALSSDGHNQAGIFRVVPKGLA